MERLIQYFKTVMESDFFAGFLYGAGTMVALLLCLWLVVACVAARRRRKNNKGITISGEFGELFLSRNAIRDAVASLTDVFPEFEVMQIRLEKTAKENRLVIGATFRHGKRSLAEAAKGYRNAVKTLFQETLGIEEMPVVRIELKNIKGGIELPIPSIVSQQLEAPDVNAINSGL